MSVFFGTDGIRGIAGRDLTAEVAYRCGRSLGLLAKNMKVVIGTDTRVSNSYLVNSLSAGLMECGADVVFVGIIPTAGISYLTKELNFNYGVAITASHNPKEYNGIKIFSSKGEKLSEFEELQIEKNIIKTNVSEVFRLGSFTYDKSLVKKYKKHLLDVGGALEGMKIVIDGANGAGYKLAPDIFKELGARVYKFCCQNKGDEINNNCGALYPKNLAKKVLKLNADFGFCYDGDSDRLIAVDEKGEIVDGDLLLCGLAKRMKQRNKLKNNAVVGTSQTNMGIELELKKNGIDFYRADVGDKYVLELMKKNNLSLGGEQSGHIIISEYMPTGDGILASILVASMCKKENIKLGEFAKVDLFPQENINVVVKDKIRVLGSEILADAVSNVQQELSGRGRVLVRASGTEPKIRIMVESDSQTKCESLAKYLKQVVELI